MNLFAVAREIADRLIRIFLRDESGRRPVFGGTEKFQTDPHWKDYILFYEYFHGDNGAGLGAGHQTGWTGLVAMLTELFGRVDPEHLLETGKPGFKENDPKTQPPHTRSTQASQSFAN
jgi:mannose/cellobiose epimerase-like protein (N-acyl-D-glucosamine 2-epimerase family)